MLHSASCTLRHLRKEDAAADKPWRQGDVSMTRTASGSHHSPTIPRPYLQAPDALHWRRRYQMLQGPQKYDFRYAQHHRHTVYGVYFGRVSQVERGAHLGYLPSIILITASTIRGRFRSDVCPKNPSRLDRCRQTQQPFQSQATAAYTR